MAPKIRRSPKMRRGFRQLARSKKNRLSRRDGIKESTQRGHPDALAADFARRRFAFDFHRKRAGRSSVRRGRVDGQERAQASRDRPNALL